MTVTTTEPQPRTRRRGRTVLIVVGVLVALMLAALIGLVVLAAIFNRPATVPDSFRSPTAVPAGDRLPADRMAFDSDRSGNFEVYTMAVDGSSVTPVTEDSAYDSWWPRLSPDRRTILFYRTPAGTHDRDYTQTSLWAMQVDGTGLTQLRPAGLDGWAQQGHAEWSPDGKQLVMFGGSRMNPQVFVTDVLGQHPRQLTDRGGVNIDPSFSADGTSVLFVGCPESICQPEDQEIYRVSVSGGEPERLTFDDLRDNDPYESPRGNRIAWLTQVSGGDVGVWDVRVSDADGRDPRFLVQDQGVTSRPQWSADGETIYVHRIPPGGDRFQLYEIPAGGGELVPLTEGQPGSNEYPSP